MANSQLYQYLKEKGVTRREAAQMIGVSYQHLVEVLNGTRPLTDNTRLKIARAFPETAAFILQLDLPMPTPEASR